METLHFTLDESIVRQRYSQITQHLVGDGSEYVPSRSESGFLHLLPDNQVEITNTQLGGREEVMIGSCEMSAIGFLPRLRSARFANDPRMEKATRTISVEGDTMHYTMRKQTTAVPHLAFHLEATLQRRK